MGLGMFAGGFSNGLSNGLGLYMRQQQLEMVRQEQEQRTRELERQQRLQDEELKRLRDVENASNAASEDALRIGTQQDQTALAGQQPTFDTAGVQDASAAITDAKRELRRAAESGGEQAQGELEALNAGPSASIVQGTPKTYTVEDWKDNATRNAAKLGIAGSKQWREGLATDAARVTYDQLQKHVASGDFEGFMSAVNRAPDGYKLQMIADPRAGGFHVAYVKDGQTASFNRDGSVTNGRYIGHYDSPQALMADYAARVSGPDAWSKHYLGERAIQSRNDIAALKADIEATHGVAGGASGSRSAKPEPSIGERATKFLIDSSKGGEQLTPDQVARYATNAQLLIQNPENQGMSEYQAYEIAYKTTTNPNLVKPSIRTDANGVPFVALVYRDPNDPVHSREYTLRSSIDESALASYGMPQEQQAEAATIWWKSLPEARRAEFSQAVRDPDGARAAVMAAVPEQSRGRALQDLDRVVRWAKMADQTLDTGAQQAAVSTQQRSSSYQKLQAAYDEWQAAKGPWYMPTPMSEQRRIRELEDRYNRMLQLYQRDELR